RGRGEFRDEYPPEQGEGVRVRAPGLQDLRSQGAHHEDYARKLAQMQGDDTYFRIAATIEDTVVRELASKRVFPNVDFYSGLVFHGLGIPTDLFTPVFALSRISGWTAHVIEYWEDNRLLRPLDWYVGPRDLAYVPLDERA